MKEFFRDYSYYSVKMFLNQFAIALLGLTLSLVFVSAGSRAGNIVSSICSVLFYLFLIYVMTWDVGYQDRARIRSGKTTEAPLRGLYISLLGNSLNIILAILFTAGIKVSGLIALLIEGMYSGIMSTHYKTIIENGEPVGIPLNNAWWAYFLIIVPALLVSTISYYLGTKDIRFTSLTDPINPEAAEIKRMKKRK